MGLTLRDRRFPAFASLTLLFGSVLLLSHPYTGIRHDGTLYFGEALSGLLPGGLKDDPYFLYGSQGRYTILPALYGQLIRAFGIGTGSLVGLLATFTLYLASSVWLIAALAPRKLLPYSVCTLLLGWTLYGGQRVFAYAESFLTARSLAEPIVLIALGFLVRGRLVAAGCALVVAAAVHPLVALAGIVVLWLTIVIDRRSMLPWTALLAGAALAVVAALLRIGPFTDLFARYDATWLPLVQEANSQAFVAKWAARDFAVVAFDVVLLWLVGRSMPASPARTLLVAAVTGGLGSIAVSFVMVDGLGSAFFGKLQLWRVEWLLQWLAMAMVPVVLLRLWSRDLHGRVAACLIAMGWLVMWTPWCVAAASAAVAIDALRARFTISIATFRIVCGVVATTAALLLLQHEARVVSYAQLDEVRWTTVVGQVLSAPVLLLAMAGLTIGLLRRHAFSAVACALLAFVIALGTWDQRDPWTRRLESYRAGESIWPGVIEPNARVYWYRDLIAPWVLLGHSNYYTKEQTAGAVFSREMVYELDRRRKVTAVLELQEQICRVMNGLSERPSACEPDVEAVTNVCREAAIDYVVLQSRLDGAASIARFDSGVVENGYEKTFYLYRCSALKSG